jgi:hypothetical protein
MCPRSGSSSKQQLDGQRTPFVLLSAGWQSRVLASIHQYAAAHKCLIDDVGVLRDVGFRSFEGSTGLALNVPGPPSGVVFVTNCRPVEPSRSWCGS